MHCKGVRGREVGVLLLLMLPPSLGLVGMVDLQGRGVV
jgi:hypothetical protein